MAFTAPRGFKSTFNFSHPKWQLLVWVFIGPPPNQVANMVVIIVINAVDNLWLLDCQFG